MVFSGLKYISAFTIVLLNSAALCVLGIQLVRDTWLMENKLDSSCDFEKAAVFTLLAFKTTGYCFVYLSSVSTTWCQLTL